MHTWITLNNIIGAGLWSPGEFGVRLRDEGGAVPGADADERGGPEVPHLPHGGERPGGGEGRVLHRRDLLRPGAPAPREDRLQVAGSPHTPRPLVHGDLNTPARGARRP